MRSEPPVTTWSIKPCKRVNCVSGTSLTVVTSTTSVSSLAALSAGVGSTSFAVTLALLVKVPVAVVVTSISIVAVPPFAIDPRSQVIGPTPGQLPWLGVAETSVMLAGNVSVTVTPVAVWGPALETSSVYSSGPLTAVGSGLSVIVNVRSAMAGATVTRPLNSEVSPDSVAVALSWSVTTTGAANDAIGTVKLKRFAVSVPCARPLITPGP